MGLRGHPAALDAPVGAEEGKVLRERQDRGLRSPRFINSYRSFPIARAKAASAATLCEGRATGVIPTARLGGASAMDGASAVDGGKS
jgi:hypothetical protein